jgi:TusA-related sulfurtransferase
MIKEKILDLTNYDCPMIFVKTKVFLQETKKNDIKILIVKGISNKNSLKNTLSEQGFNITVQELKKNTFKIFLN